MQLYSFKAYLKAARPRFYQLSGRVQGHWHLPKMLQLCLVLYSTAEKLGLVYFEVASLTATSYGSFPFEHYLFSIEFEGRQV